MILTIEETATIRDTATLVATSGGFDPLHVGHLRCLRQAAELGSALLVVVNGDEYLLRKKGHLVMPLADRMEIMDSVRWVDYVVGFQDDSDTVCDALRAIRPQIFAKGITLEDPRLLPEWQVCREIGCRVVLDVGGPKIRSSSSLIAAQQNAR